MTYLDSAVTAPPLSNPAEVTPYQRWSVEIGYAEKELKKFHERARNVTRRFVDERDALSTHLKWFNMFHANVKIMRAALYAQLPKPEVQRKYLDYKDDVARVAANILQRCITPDQDDPRDTFDAVMKNVVFDRLVPGLGAAWLRLETDTEDVELSLESSVDVGEAQPGGEHDSPLNSGFATGPAPEMASQPAAVADAPQQEPVAPKTFKRITDQRVVIDYVYYEDFIWSPCRVWEERRWTGRRVYMDREELIQRFGDVGKKVPLNTSPLRDNLMHGHVGLTPTHQAVDTAVVYEIWDREKREVIWYCKDYPELLDVRPDFLNLIGFEPCPSPLLANVPTATTIPRPDYFMVQDQYSELDTINNRISKLIEACKVVGVYDRSAEGVQRMLQEGSDNTLIPVDNWAMFAEKGGVKGQIDWLPLDVVISTMNQLNAARDVIKQEIYELTGISDIIRGASKASETLGAQQIKAQFASVRIKDMQDEIARFASQILRLKAEMMVKHFDPEILLRKSNILRTDDAMMAQQAIALLQSEEGFEWRITVTADQLAQADYMMQKQERTELLTAIGQYISQIRDVVIQAPQFTPMFVTMLKWAIAGFHGAREIEGLLDRELDAMMKQQQQPQPQKPDPQAQKLQMDMQKTQLDMQVKQQAAQLDAQSKLLDLQATKAKHQQDLQYSAAKQQLDITSKLQNMFGVPNGT